MDELSEIDISFFRSHIIDFLDNVEKCNNEKLNNYEFQALEVFCSDCGHRAG